MKRLYPYTCRAIFMSIYDHSASPHRGPAAYEQHDWCSVEYKALYSKRLTILCLRGAKRLGECELFNFLMDLTIQYDTPSLNSNSNLP